MANTVDLKLYSDLLDGRYFLIPAYQRGYRWGERQIEYLLLDLYSFYLNSGPKDFYCLQPVIVQKVTDTRKVQAVQDACSIIVNNEIGHDDELNQSLDIIENNLKTDCKHSLWEVIDGQQRLTTLYILYRYLMYKKGQSVTDLAMNYRKVLYSLFYESRPHSFTFIGSINKNSVANDIDEKHMLEAINIIDTWIYKKATKIPEFIGKVPMNIIDGLFDLLNGNQTSKSVKVIWYEIDPRKKDIIKEFLNVNTGKIGLTDSELVKALFLQDRGDKNAVDQMALDWERIENSLNQSDFWSFLSTDNAEEHNRISILLNIMYELNSSNPDNKEDNYLFDYYYNKVFSRIPTYSTIPDKLKFVHDEWQKIVDCYRTIEDWYNNPPVYNFVGYLSQFGKSISEIYKLYEDPTTTSYKDFEQKLKNKAKELISQVKVQDGLIMNKYGEPIIKRILLYANVNQLNKQFENGGKVNSSVFKFPFDVYQSQKWNVEHIDSQTANDMKEISAQENWIKAAESSFKELCGNSEYQNVKKAGDNLETIAYVQRWIGEDTDDKHSIGNLALLDAKTNDSYGNSLFVEKRAIIAEKIKQGQFVPLCTQWAFSKHFGESIVPDLTRWTKKDKDDYNKFILQNIQ